MPSRREFLAAGLGFVGGAATDRFVSSFPSEEGQVPSVGGIWEKVEQNGDHLILELQVNAQEGIEVHHVNFTASPSSSPNIKPDPENIEQGSWHILGSVRPVDGICHLDMSLSHMGASGGQTIEVSADVYGREIKTGHLVLPNYAPNGTKQLGVR